MLECRRVPGALFLSCLFTFGSDSLEKNPLDRGELPRSSSVQSVQSVGLQRSISVKAPYPPGLGFTPQHTPSGGGVGGGGRGGGGVAVAQN